MKRSFLVLVLAPAIGISQDRPPIATDRPGFSDGSNLVLPGTTQIEAGLFSTKVGGQTFLTIPDLLLRHGVNKNLELRVVGLSYGFYPGGTKGWLDPSIGLKVRLYQGAGEVTFVGQTTVPVGASPLRANEWNATAKIAWTKPVRTDTLGGNLVVQQLGSGNARFAQTAVSLYLSRPVSAKVGVTPEVWVVDRIAKGQKGAGFVSIAGTFLVHNDLQLDLRVGTGFNQRRDGWFIQAGFSMRF